MIQTLHNAIRAVQADTGLVDGEAALAAFQIVTESIVRRLTPAEANDFIAQLPSALHEPLLDLPAGPDERVTFDTVRGQLTERLELDAESVANVIAGIGRTLQRSVSPGELRDVLAQLPQDMHPLIVADPGSLH